MALRYRQGTSPQRRADNALAVMQWVLAVLPAGEDTVVSVTAHQCGDPQCTAATTILLMRPEQPALPIKIPKPMESVTEADIAAALHPTLSPAP
ncbi:MAG TPA: hypothetical protein VGJ20_35940 [Xanthobacteraceae bacterium]|jgi:hypothetical protein